MSSSLSSFLPQRAMLVSERNKGWTSEKPMIPPQQKEIPNWNKSVREWNDPRIVFFHSSNAANFTPPNANNTQNAEVIKSRQNPFGKRYD